MYWLRERIRAGTSLMLDYDEKCLNLWYIFCFLLEKVRLVYNDKLK